MTQESQGAAKSLARETTGGTRAAPGMFPCAGLRELVLPERALIKRETRLYRAPKKNAESSRTRRDGIFRLDDWLSSSVRLFA